MPRVTVRRALAISILGAAAGCGPPGPIKPPSGSGAGPLSRAADAQMILIPLGMYVSGSTPEERDVAYDDYLATSGRDDARENEWFEREEERHVAELPAFRIDLMPVTNAQYAEFVGTGAAPAPSIDEATWAAQGYVQDFATEVARFIWPSTSAPIGREEHPVVLVTWDQANAYCAWRGSLLGGAMRRLPTAAEREKAARGREGFIYPWGNTWQPDKLNSAVKGPSDTVPVGSFPDGASPYGVLDLAGNVFEWTSTPWPPGASTGARERTVRGSAWEDFAGVGRGAAWHGRAHDARHVIVGFRCASDAEVVE
jgi:formylglycine-generating enzyme required for sulfatase activity